MKSLAFAPDTVHATVGQTVEWTNDDTPAHNVTYVSGPKFASSPTMNPGAKFSIKLTQAGTIHYFCSIHPFMKATIVVTK
jgi:plastocyanin